MIMLLQKESRKPGKSDTERSLGSTEEKIERHLQTLQDTTTENDDQADKEEV